MYEKYHKRGFELIAFPANQFGCQAPYSSAVERDYAYEKFGMRFPIYDKIGVKRRGNSQCDGPQSEHPLYTFLKREKPFSDEIEWNYVKVRVHVYICVCMYVAADSILTSQMELD